MASIADIKKLNSRLETWSKKGHFFSDVTGKRETLQGYDAIQTTLKSLVNTNKSLHAQTKYDNAGNIIGFKASNKTAEIFKDNQIKQVLRKPTYGEYKARASKKLKSSGEKATTKNITDLLQEESTINEIIQNRSVLYALENQGDERAISILDKLRTSEKGGSRVLDSNGKANKISKEEWQTISNLLKDIGSSTKYKTV